MGAIFCSAPAPLDVMAESSGVREIEQPDVQAVGKVVNLQGLSSHV